jgi:hypothetical protein
MLNKIYKIFLYIFAIIGFVLIFGFIFYKLGWLKNSGIVDSNFNYYDKSRSILATETYGWINTTEWQTLKTAITKDKDTLQRAENETGIKARLLASILFVEQMRLYNSDSELFKKIFEPLSILGVQSQFSWGVMGLKQETLIKIENNLKDSKSPFYLGKENENLLDFSANNKNIDETRFNRITDEHNNYYSYLYTAIFIEQLEKQWENAGFDISERPEIIATLYNIGFEHSVPNANPQVGGAEIDIANQKYSFGGLAYEFYNSNELLDIFPR